MAKNKNTEQQVDENLANEFAGWEEENVGFPPYWNPETDKSFLATVVMLDDRDPVFTRYVLQAKKPLTCLRGPKKEQEPVDVKAGEFFTCSTYAGLPLAGYVGLDVLVTVKGTRDVGRPQPMWVFSIRVSPETRKILADRRAKAATLAQSPQARAQMGQKSEEVPFS